MFLLSFALDQFSFYRHLERARIALDIENGMTPSQRKKKINKYWVDVQGERYLQVEQVNNNLFYTKDEDEDND